MELDSTLVVSALAADYDSCHECTLRQHRLCRWERGACCTTAAWPPPANTAAKLAPPVSQPSSSNRDKTIPPHTRGIMVSAVAGKEQQAARDAIALFTEAYEALKEQPEGGAGEASAEAPPAPADPAAALASEVAALKNKDAQLFYWHHSGLNSVVYVEYRGADSDPSPTQLVMHVCEQARGVGRALWGRGARGAAGRQGGARLQLSVAASAPPMPRPPARARRPQAKATKQSRSRFACRFHPVEHQCFASMEKIEELAAKVVEQHFPTGEGVEPIPVSGDAARRARVHGRPAGGGGWASPLGSMIAACTRLAPHSLLCSTSTALRPTLTA